MVVSRSDRLGLFWHFLDIVWIGIYSVVLASGDAVMIGMRAYLTGFTLAVVLTAIPFGLVALKALPAAIAFAIVGICAIAQILVHLRYFLHIDFRHSPRENIVALAFTGILIGLMIGGSLWIMFDLHARMMPG